MQICVRDVLVWWWFDCDGLEEASGGGVIRVVLRFSRGGKVDGWKSFSWWWCDLA